MREVEILQAEYSYVVMAVEITGRDCYTEYIRQVSI